MSGAAVRTTATGRKQWNIHELRNQLAEDGCIESQVKLAKQLLSDNCEIVAVREANNRQAVYWLIRAAEQDNQEGTALLTQCFRDGRGVTEENYGDIKACLDMTPGQKIARKAARDLFSSLSNGEEYITVNQLEDRMREIYHCQRKTNKFNDASAIEASPESRKRYLNHEHRNITEDNLVAAAMTYSNGYLPPVTQALSISVPPPNALDHIPFFSRPLLHPLLTLQLIYYKLLRLANLSLKGYNNLHLFILLFGYSLFNTENMLLFVPMGFYYLSFIVMIISTFEMLSTQREFVDFRIWSGLFLRYSDGNLNNGDAEFQFIRNKLRPYIHFFIALLINLILYPIVAAQWIPQSEFTVISFCLTFVTLVVFIKSNSYRSVDFITLFSFCINVLAKYPYENDAVVNQGWRFLDLNVPTFPSYIVGNGIEFCLNFRVLFYILIPGILVIMAHKNNWRGVYKYLIPHCVTLSWLQIFIISSQGATMFGLVRGTLMLVGCVLFLPLVAVATVFLPVVAAVDWLSTVDIVWRAGVSLAMFIIALIMSCVLAPNRKFGKYVTIFQIGFGIIALVFLGMPYVQNNKSNISEIGVPEDNIYESLVIDKQSDIEPEHFEYLSWDMFQQMCHQAAWDKMNKVLTQINCAKLNGIKVKWEGYVTDLEIKSVRNVWSEITDKLPSFLETYIKCTFGQKNNVHCNDKECFIVRKLLEHGNYCNLDYWNRYEYGISLHIQSGMLSKGAEVLLRGSHEFSNFTQKLHVNDRIWFKGRLSNDKHFSLGNSKPIIKIYEIGCIGCLDSKLSSFELSDTSANSFSNIFNDVFTGMKSVLNFMFNPIVIFK